MKENVGNENPILKMKRAVWELRVGVYSAGLIKQSTKKSATKIWDIKVILN